MLRRMRQQKKQILRGVAQTGLNAAPCHSPDHECGAHTALLLPSVVQAEQFSQAVGNGAFIAGRTGRHVYTEWDPVLARRGAPHRAVDPFRLPENRRCRRRYRRDMCASSLKILDRAVLIPNHPDRTPAQTTRVIARIRKAAGRLLAGFAQGVGR